jgi:hypothetical protein
MTDKLKICVARNVLNKETGNNHTGVFTWVGKSWRTGTITALVKELPAGVTDKELRDAYNAERRARRSV